MEVPVETQNLHTTEHMRIDDMRKLDSSSSRYILSGCPSDETRASSVDGPTTSTSFTTSNSDADALLPSLNSMPRHNRKRLHTMPRDMFQLYSLAEELGAMEILKLFSREDISTGIITWVSHEKEEKPIFVNLNESTNKVRPVLKRTFSTELSKRSFGVKTEISGTTMPPVPPPRYKGPRCRPIGDSPLCDPQGHHVYVDAVIRWAPNLFRLRVTVMKTGKVATIRISEKSIISASPSALKEIDHKLTEELESRAVLQQNNYVSIEDGREKPYILVFRNPEIRESFVKLAALLQTYDELLQMQRRYESNLRPEKNC